MAGWSKAAVEDEKRVICTRKIDTSFDIEPGLEPGLDSVKIEHDNKNVKSLFTEFLTSFYKEFYGPYVLRPLPPMLGDGQSVDLLKLYLSVSKKGGYFKVSENGLWDSVAEECGFDPRFVSDLKLVYAKYLDLLEKWLQTIGNNKSSEVEQISNFGGASMDLELRLKGMLGKYLNKKKIEEDSLNLELKNDLNLELKTDPKLVLKSDLNMELNQSVENIESFKMVKEEEISRKRKRENYPDLMKYITKVAQNPCDLSIGSIPEKSKWKSFKNEHLWKQVLLIRESLLIRKYPDSTIWQNKPMHPYMYEEFSISERLRCSRRLLTAKEPVNKSSENSLSSNTDEEITEKSSADSKSSLWVITHRKKKIPLGENHQIEVPKWDGKKQESDSKWLGSRIWPLDMNERGKNVIELDRIGKGRQDSCGCACVNSIECVKFHVSEKRNRIKIELGTGFHMMKFNNMGEEVSSSWTKEDVIKFNEIVKNNPFSLEKKFWEELYKGFQGKGRESLVRYYFNVFVLRRRAFQNRICPSDIDSDDDEMELGII